MGRKVLVGIHGGGPTLNVVTNICAWPPQSGSGSGAGGSPAKFAGQIAVQKQLVCFPPGTTFGKPFCRVSCGPSGSGCGPCRRWCGSGSGSGDGHPPNLGPCSGSGSGVGSCQTVCGPGSGLPSRLWATLSGGPLFQRNPSGPDDTIVSPDGCPIFDAMPSIPLDFAGETAPGGCQWSGRISFSSVGSFFLSLTGQPPGFGPSWTVGWNWPCTALGGQSISSPFITVTCQPFHVSCLLGSSATPIPAPPCCPAPPFGCISCYNTIQCDITT